MKRTGAMPCEYCDGRVRPHRVRDEYWSGDNLIIIENVPVGLCDRCGERYYDASVMERMERIAARHRKIRRRISVPVATFDEVA